MDKLHNLNKEIFPYQVGDIEIVANLLWNGVFMYFVILLMLKLKAVWNLSVCCGRYFLYR